MLLKEQFYKLSEALRPSRASAHLAGSAVSLGKKHSLSAVTAYQDYISIKNYSINDKFFLNKLVPLFNFFQYLLHFYFK